MNRSIQLRPPPGASPETQSVFADLQAQLAVTIGEIQRDFERRIAALEGEPAGFEVKRASFTARAGQVVTVEAPPEGLTVTLPAARATTRRARIVVTAKNANPVRWEAAGGQVNGARQVTSNAPGAAEAICDGQAWHVSIGAATSTGSAASTAGATYFLESSDTGLPNARVADDSTEIDLDYTTPALVSWFLKTASVVVAKLQDLTGLSVLGRAANSSGVMAAITATGARQVLRVNDAGTALEWGNPVQVSDEGVDVGDFFNLDFEDGNGLGVAITDAGSGRAIITYGWDGLFVYDGAVFSNYYQGLQFNDGTGIVVSVTDNNPTGTVTISASNVPASALANIAGLSVLGNATSSSAAVTAITASGALQYLRVTAPGTGLEWSNLSIHASTSVAYTSDQFQRAALTGAVEASANSNSTVFSTGASGAGLTGGGTSVLAVGAGTRITVNANDVQLAAGAAESFLGNFTAGSAVADYRAGSSVAGAGLTYAAGGTLAVGAGDGIDVAADSVAVDVTDIIDNVSITEVATNNIQRAALTGDVTASAGSNATTITNNAVGDAKLRDSGACSVIGRSANSSGDPADISAGTNDRFLQRVSNALSWGQLTDGMVPTNTVGLTKLANIAAETFLGNITGSSGSVTANSLATLAGDGLDYSGGIMEVAANSTAHIRVDSGGVGFRKSRHRHFWFEEFDFLEYTSGPAGISTGGVRITLGQTPWFVQSVSSAGTVDWLAPEAGHPGILQLTTSTSSGNAITLRRNGVATNTVTRMNELYSFECIARLGSSANVFFEIGFTDSPISGLSNGAVFYFDTTLDTTVHFYTEEAGAATDTDLGTVPGTGWVVYTIIQESVGTLDAYMDDVLELSTTSNVPDTEDCNIAISVLTRTNAAKSLDVDYVSYESQYLGTRTS